MRIEISKIPEEGTDYTGEETPEALGLAGDPAARLEGPVQCDFFVQVVSKELLVKGHLRVPISCQCAKCAEFFSTTLTDLSFLRAYELSEGLDSVDLTEDIREELLLGIPGFPVCSPTCKGLCPRCGKNLNEGACECRPLSDSDGWNALDGLKL